MFVPQDQKSCLSYSPRDSAVLIIPVTAHTHKAALSHQQVEEEEGRGGEKKEQNGRRGGKGEGEEEKLEAQRTWVAPKFHSCR